MDKSQEAIISNVPYPVLLCLYIANTRYGFLNIASIDPLLQWSPTSGAILCRGSLLAPTAISPVLVLPNRYNGIFQKPFALYISWELTGGQSELDPRVW